MVRVCPEVEVVQERDALMEEAIRWAGPNLEPHPVRPSFLEGLLEKAVIAGVETLRPGAHGEQTGARKRPLPNWMGSLGDIDLKIWLRDEKRPSILAEAKVEDVDQTLWDLLKLADSASKPSVVATYLVVAAPRMTWRSSKDCVALFEDRPEPKEWETRKFFADWPKAW